MSQNWEFLEDTGGRWHWRSSRADGSHAVSDTTFESGIACVMNAMRNGYLAGTSLAAAVQPPAGITRRAAPAGPRPRPS